MLPTTTEGVLALLLAIVPGYVAATVWARSRTWRGAPSDVRLVLLSLVLSLVIGLLVFPVTYAWIYPIRSELESYPERAVVWLLGVTVVVPAVLGLLAGRITDLLNDPQHSGVQGRFRETITRVWPAAAPPSVWDWLFTVRPPNARFLVVTFTDGSSRAGVFADGSIAFTSPEPHGLYLAGEWSLDENGYVSAPIPDSDGILIPSTNMIRSIRILRSGDDEG